MGADVESTGMGQADTSPEDLRLFEVLQQLVGSRGRMRAATALGVNYRTVVGNLEAGSLSRRMRRALQEFEAGLEPAESPDLEGSRGSYGRTETVAQQMETLAGEVGHLTEMVEAQGGQLQELGLRVAGLEDVARERTAGNVGPDEGLAGEWRPPEREQGLPDAGVVTVDPQPDEEHAFGPAAGLVAQWRDLRTDLPNRSSRVDRARATERWWELGVILMEKYHLTLPTEHGAVAGTGEGGLPAAAQGASDAGPRATCHGRTVGEVPQSGDHGAVAGVDDARGWDGRTHRHQSASPSTPHRRSRTLPRTLGLATPSALSMPAGPWGPSVPAGHGACIARQQFRLDHSSRAPAMRMSSISIRSLRSSALVRRFSSAGDRVNLTRPRRSVGDRLSPAGPCAGGRRRWMSWHTPLSRCLGKTPDFAAII